jgi:hypothetical protein
MSRDSRGMTGCLAGAALRFLLIMQSHLDPPVRDAFAAVKAALRAAGRR